MLRLCYYDNPVDIPIDRILLNETKGTGERHYRLRKPSERIEIVRRH